MKALWKIIKYFLMATFLIIFLVIGFTAYLIQRSEITIGNENLLKVESKLRNLGLDIRWSSGSLVVHSHSLFEKRIEITFKNLCINLPQVEVKGCLENLEVGGTILFKGMKFHLLDGGPLKVTSNNFLVKIRPSTGGKPGTPGLFSQFISPSTNFHDLDIVANGFKFATKKSVYEGTLSVGDKGSLGQNKPWHLTGFLNAVEPKAHTKVSGTFDIEGKKFLFSVPLEMNANLNIALGDELNAKAKIDYQYINEDAGDYRIQINLQKGKLDISGHLTGKINQEKTGGQLKALVESSGYKFSFGDRDPCEYTVGFSGKIDLECPFGILLPSQAVPGIDITQDLQALRLALRTHLQLAGKSEGGQLWSGTTSLHVGTNGRPSFKIEGNIESSFDHSPLNENVLKKLKSEAALQVSVDHFEQLVKRLKTTPYGIPAPLNVLAGSIQCAFKGEFLLSDLRAPFNCQTNLQSPMEKLKLSANGFFGMIKQKEHYKPDLSVDVLLQDVQLALPHFGLKGPPPFIPDSRFKRTLVMAKPTGSFSLNYRVGITTSQTTPIRILSNLAKTPIPVDLTLVVQSSAGPTGSVRIKEFPVKLFHREARVKFFDLRLATKEDETIHGLVEVIYTDYKIDILLEGTTQEPIVHFESNPPLSQDEIISVLLFGRKLDEINPDQTGSVASTQAALTDKAIALSSMYLLASTPVESIGYNSQTQTFTAKIHLAEGTSLDVGAGGAGFKQVGVNRHLGGPWYIYTFLRNPTGKEDRSTASFLEWVLRY